MKVDRYAKREETIVVTLTELELALLVREKAQIPPEFENYSATHNNDGSAWGAALHGVRIKFYRKETEPL